MHPKKHSIPFPARETRNDEKGGVEIFFLGKESNHTKDSIFLLWDKKRWNRQKKRKTDNNKLNRQKTNKIQTTNKQKNGFSWQWLKEPIHFSSLLSQRYKYKYSYKLVENAILSWSLEEEEADTGQGNMNFYPICAVHIFILLLYKF